MLGVGLGVGDAHWFAVQYVRMALLKRGSSSVSMGQANERLTFHSTFFHKSDVERLTFSVIVPIDIPEVDKNKNFNNSSVITYRYCIQRNFRDLTIIAIIATKLKTLLMLNAIYSGSLILVIYILVIYILVIYILVIYTQSRYF